MPYSATPCHETPVLGVMKFTNLVDPSLVIITIYFFWPMFENREKIFKEIMHFNYMIYMITA